MSIKINDVVRTSDGYLGVVLDINRNTDDCYPYQVSVGNTLDDWCWYDKDSLVRVFGIDDVYIGCFGGVITVTKNGRSAMVALEDKGFMAALSEALLTLAKELSTPMKYFVVMDDASVRDFTTVGNDEVLAVKKTGNLFLNRKKAEEAAERIKAIFAEYAEE